MDTPLRRDNLAALRCEGVGDFQYGLKTGDPFHHGPYAMLVREVAFHSAKVSNHDYLHLPEIIEDICNGYEHRFGESIMAIVCGGLHKCIVKFSSAKVLDDHLLGVALLYCWGEINNEEFSSYANTCFDAEAQRIEPHAILSVTKL
ncbi:hypothetical protein [Pseudomonas sp. LS-2]|uniref:hypothetical protein n=1 Tax=Pseudomonas sp. LS-2 TaxID=2315859 RepID=UPI001058A8B8|nr:hypothetical protein [Pseudomonas sp. LS-2]